MDDRFTRNRDFSAFYDAVKRLKCVGTVDELVSYGQDVARLLDVMAEARIAGERFPMPNPCADDSAVFHLRMAVRDARMIWPELRTRPVEDRLTLEVEHVA